MLPMGILEFAARFVARLRQGFDQCNSYAKRTPTPNLADPILG